MLPSQLRSWIGRAYRQGLAADAHPTRYYVKAHQAALAWIAENCTTEDEHAR
ncbi:hypothetical protein [Caballeronia pedi]|nr:hypothetical protein [Caballeronia pedi]